MTYLKQSTGREPATHALVIGVGKYEPNGWNLSDLPCTINSANAFAQWLLKSYRNTAGELDSVDLLWSPAGPAQNARNEAGNEVAIETASMQNVAAAVARWFVLCDQSFDNHGIFYFCGHGLQKGVSKYLLTDGFDAPGNLSIAGDAIDFSNFALGMERCKARKQTYFIDACRNTPQKSLAISTQLGRAIVDPDYSKIATTLPRDWPAIFAAAEGQSAFGADGTISRFTSALLSALEGGGWDDRDAPWQQWQVRTDTLVHYICQLLKYEEDVHGAPPQLARNAGDSAGFVFHEPAPGQFPRVPLLVGCEAEQNNATTHFRIMRSGNELTNRKPIANNWELMLDAAPDYVIQATNGAVTVQKDVALRPACKIARL